MKWNTETDKFSIPLTVNISRRRRGITTGPDLTLESLKNLEEAILAKRITLSLTMSLYDPMGFICPLTIRLKWLLQQIGKEKLKPGWDEPLTKDEKEPWLEIIRLMVEQGSVTFNRSCKPEDVV